LKASGVNPDRLVEIVEIEDHPFIGVQYHPEYKVRLQTHILNFVAAAVKAKRNNFSTSKDSEI
jgi:gamma-glutamyl-gamma-aminobutyrate hydrolase PuuD